MNTLEFPNQRIIHLAHQPDYPSEDLTPDNAEMLKYLLSTDEGLDSYSANLAPRQHYIYQLAHRALKLMKVDSSVQSRQIDSFSHGFAGMETVSDIIRERPVYPHKVAAKRVAEMFVDTRSIRVIDSERSKPNATPEGIIEEGLLPRYLEVGHDHVELPPSYLDVFVEQKKRENGPFGHDRPRPVSEIAHRHQKFHLENPNTSDVIITLGEKRQETDDQIVMRLAGAALAHSLQTTD